MASLLLIAFSVLDVGPGGQEGLDLNDELIEVQFCSSYRAIGPASGSTAKL
jgi:hypothetical protein